ncbi:TPA: hypothetical protein DEB00_01355 [Candidatus Uhrbacteria bacterium]|nr:hypothetical protein [Candidatus Uhrbacteria bacterium]
MYDLLTIGDIKLDVFIDLGNDAKVFCAKDTRACEMRIKYGQKIPVDSAVSMMAGSAPNVAIGARKLGLSTSILSVVGDDTTATLAMDTLKKEGISTDYVQIAKNEQSSFSAILNFQGESTILAVHHPHTYLVPDSIEASWIFVTEMGPNYQSLFNRLIALKQEKKLKLSINPGAIQLEELDQSLFDLIGLSELLIVNKEEAKTLLHVDSHNVQALLRGLQAMGPRVVILTDGENGAYGTENTVIYHAPIFTSTRVEATGAGDAMATGMLAALASGFDLPTALTWGTVNASQVIQYVGPQKGLQTRQQILHLLRQSPYAVTTI